MERDIWECCYERGWNPIIFGPTRHMGDVQIKDDGTWASKEQQHWFHTDLGDRTLVILILSIWMKIFG
jgi:hypothetical protein